ncbi:MAG: citryl-CoA lyase [Candidatus Tectomicrobia bacterium]|nr:citryl-CoA lyase [Candidatus Tectomicrobia bacterium]
MADDFWRTELSFVARSKILVRGYRIEDLMERCSFGDVVYLMFAGELPKGNEGKLIEAILVSSVDHSLAAPSIDAARFVASCGVPMQAAVASGVNALGDIHGGAIEQCAKMFQEALAAHPGVEHAEVARRVVQQYRQAKQRILGYGHPIHNPDPRTLKMLELAERLHLIGPNTSLALALEGAIKEGFGRELPLNVDGAIAALISDLGIDWRLGKGFFIIARTVGLVAHSHEQMTKERPFKAAAASDIVYNGPPERDLPAAFA